MLFKYVFPGKLNQKHKHQKILLLAYPCENDKIRIPFYVSKYTIIINPKNLLSKNEKTLQSID